MACLRGFEPPTFGSGVQIGGAHQLSEHSHNRWTVFQRRGSRLRLSIWQVITRLFGVSPAFLVEVKIFFPVQS